MPGAVDCEGVSSLTFHLHGSNFKMPVPEPRGVCRHHTFEQAPLGSRVVRLEFGAANILVYVFLYLSLHQNNFVTQSHSPEAAGGVLMRSGGLGRDRKECVSSTSWHLS